MLAQMETGTDQDCTDQESKDQKTAEQFRSASAPTRTKRQRKTIPIEKQRKRLQLREKVEIYKKITENHMSYKQVEENYGISRTAVKQIKRNGPELMQQLEKEGRRGTTKTVRKIPFPLIEDGVLEYFELARKNCLPVTRRSLMTMGQVIKQRLLENHQLGAAERAEIQEFTASLHWARNVIMRNGLRHVRLWGEAGSVDSAAIAQEMENLRQKLASYELKLIFNMDETGLFFKMLPRTTYLSSKEDCATTRGTKGMRSKDRLTVLVCSNADGSLKVPLAIIGNSKNPRCFRMEKPPLYYMFQNKAWSDKRTLRDWFFFSILAFCEGPCALIQKGGSSYGQLCCP